MAVGLKALQNSKPCNRGMQKELGQIRRIPNQAIQRNQTDGYFIPKDGSIDQSGKSDWTRSKPIVSDFSTKYLQWPYFAEWKKGRSWKKNSD